MLRNYLKIAFRNLDRHRGYAFINITGLAVGLAACMLIFLFVRHEYSYDRFHEHAGRIHRLYLSVEGQEGARTNMPSAMGPALESDLPEVEHAVRLSTLYGDILIGTPTAQFYEKDFYITDADIFQVFSFPLVRGNPETALQRPYTVVLTEPMAKKYFGDADPVGQTITLNNEHTFEVTGVAAALPSNSHLQFGFLASYESRGLMNPNRAASWFGSWDLTYVLLRPDASPADVADKLSDLTISHMGAAFGDQGVRQAERMVFGLQPLTDLYLRGVPLPGGDLRLVYLLSAIAVLVLLIACVNYMNLATARYARRAREVGVRKASGAGRLQLLVQFLSESVLLCVVALAFAVTLAELFLPAFNQLTGKPLALDYLDEPVLLALFLGLALLIGVLAGSYPAFFLSSFRPVDVLKGRPAAGPRHTASQLRKGLVVFQFAVSVALIVGTLVIQRQLDYVRSKPLGFSTEQAVVIPTKNLLGDQYEAFKRELLKRPNVLHVTTSSAVPTNPNYYGLFATPEGHEQQTITTYVVDPDFLETLGMELAAGRGFSADLPSDLTGAVLINEALARTLDWDEPLGKTITLSEEETMTVVGVVKDFHYQSLKEQITPVMFQLGNRGLRFVVARLGTDDLPGTLAFLRQTWEQFLPAWPFEYTFLDQDYARLYETEVRLAQMIGYFSLLAIGIACLGLFGLFAFMAEQRTKEIGIRKVLGASVPDILALLSFDFLKLVALAFVLATPVAYLAATRWLDDFAYRIELAWWLFALAGALTLGIAALTVSYQSVRTALSDPVDALRYE